MDVGCDFRILNGNFNIVDQDSFFDEIVMKFRNIGDEFDLNLIEKMELLNLVKICFLLSLFDLLKVKIFIVCSFIDLME